MLETPLMTRRRFFQALAASVVAAGVPLPAGMPLSAAEPIYEYEMTTPWDLRTLVAAPFQKPMRTHLPDRVKWGFYPPDNVAFKPDGTRIYRVGSPIKGYPGTSPR